MLATGDWVGNPPAVEAQDGFYGTSNLLSARMDHSARTYDTDGVGPLHGLSGRAPKGDASNSVLERYSGALDMLRNQLWCAPASGNVSFEECPDEEKSSEVDEPSSSSDSSHVIKVERDLCSQSSVFLKRLLLRADRVPASVIDGVLSDKRVVRRLRKLNSTLTFGKQLYMPEDELDPEVMRAVDTACTLFNGSCVPAVMWPCTDRNIDHNERVTITNSAVFEALQIHRLLKHNRTTYVEWGRSATSGHEEGGPLPIDVIDSAVIREMSDTILDELSSTLWCIGFMALHARSSNDDKLRTHASTILSDPKDLTSRLWKYYLAFSDHVKTRCAHLKDINKTLNDKLSGRLIVEVHRVLTLQCAIVKALLDIHMGTRSMSISEYERYEAHYGRRGFSGAFSAARTVIGADECASSPLLMHAVHELQSLGSLLLSSFFLYDAFGEAKDEVTKRDFLVDTTDLMRKQLTVSGRGLSNNKSSAVLVFAYACFLKDLSGNQASRNVDASFASDVAVHLDTYSESLEWIALSRDMLSVSGSTGVATSPCRMVLLESISRIIDSFGIDKLPHLDRIIFSICRIVKGDESVSDRGYRTTKLSILERVSTYLMSHFPFGLNALFQLLAACLPHCTESHDDSYMDVDSDCGTMELIVQYLLKPFDTITLSPLIAPLEYKPDTSEFELSGDVYIVIQLLHMLGFDKQVLFKRWFNWGMGSCLYYLRSGSIGKRVSLNNLRHLSTKQNALLNEHEDSWVVDAGMQNIALDSSIGAFWIQDAQMPKPYDAAASLRGCRFELENSMCVTCHTTTGKQSAQQPEPTLHFTLLRAIWTVWRGSILYMSNMNCDLPDHALRTFVECNSLLARLLSKFPRLTSLIEDHILSSLHMRDASSQFPFGPCSLIFHYTLLFVLCLKRRQLRIMLPEVIEALRGFLIPAYVVPVGDNATEVEFSRYWIFLESFEFCCQGTAEEGDTSVFSLMDRIMQEEERPIRNYPVTRGVLMFFKELLEQCPPELWMLSGWHHGMLNMSHTSLDMESNNVTHGLGLSYLSSLKRYVDANAHKSRELYNPFQTKLLCEFFAFVLKGVSPSIADSEFADSGERLDLLCTIADIVELICRIFRVHNYDNSKSVFGDAATEAADDSWLQGLKELINRCLLTLSGSNYIMEVIAVLTCQLDVLAYHQRGSGSLVMVNALTFSEVSLDFFTVRKDIKSRTALHISSSAAPDSGYASCYQSLCSFRWLCQQEPISPLGMSKRLISSSLRLLRDLYAAALPRNRNPLFATLADSLGSNYFVKCRNEIDQRRRYLHSSDNLIDSNDPVVYYASRQLELLCVSLPQTSVVQSLIAHTYSSTTVAAATDIISLYLLLHEQYKLDSGAFVGSFATNNRILLQQLGQMRGNYDVIALSSKDEACFYEHLVCVFLDPATSSFDTRLSIMQYILVALSTCSGMEMLLNNNGLDVAALVDFVDSVLRYHVLHGRPHNLGDVTVAQYALLIFARLVELSKGAHQAYCWKSVTLSLRVLIDLWRSFDSNLFVDPDVALNQQGVVPRSTMVKELWFDQVSPDMYVDMVDSLLERRLGLLRIMGSVYAILDSLNVQLQASKSSGSDLPDDLLRLLSFVSTNWDFMDTLLPIIVYDSGFVDTYVKNDVTEKNLRQYYRLGLWLGEDCMLPLSRCLHYLHDMNVPPHLLLMSGDSPSEIKPLDIQSLLRSVVSQKLARTKSNVAEKISRHDFVVDMFRPLLSDIVGPPEANGFDNTRSESNPQEAESTTSESVHPDYSFYSFGTSGEFGHRYMMDVEMFRHFCMVLLTSADDQVNVLLSRGMASVRSCVEMVPYVDSLNELKVRLLRQLCHVVVNFRSFGNGLASRMDTLLRDDVSACEKDSLRTLKTPMPPFEMFAFNGAMLLQLVLTRPDCLSEHPVYVGLLIEFLRLLFEKSFSLPRLESSFVSYYECCRSADASDGGFVDYIVSRDFVGSSDAVGGDGETATLDKSVQDIPDEDSNQEEVGQDFRLFAVNVLGGLVAQVARCVVEFSECFHDVLNVNFKAPNHSRGFLKLRKAALQSCLMYRGRSTPKGDPTMSPGAFSDGDSHGADSHDCVCTIATGKGVDTDSVSVWLQFKMASFFSWLYKALSHATKSAHEQEPRGVEDGVMEVYQRVTKYALKSITQSCLRMIGDMQKENIRLLQCFVGNGYGILQTGELEAAYVFIMGPYVSMLALESIICTDYNASFLHGKGYVHLVELAEALTQLPYTTSACLSNQSISTGDLVNPMMVMKRDKQIMADNLRLNTRQTFEYDNRNMLRAVLHKLMERVNVMMMHGIPCKAFVSRFAASQLFQRLYVYSFLCNFVQPLDNVNPKKMLARFSDHVVDSSKGNCVEVIENSVTMWYPSYQGYRTGVAVRCPYHLLHCGLLRFVVDMCSIHDVGGVMDAVHMDSGSSVQTLILDVLHLLRSRMRHMMATDRLTLAHLEESHMLFAVLRHVPNRHLLSENDATLVNELLRYSARFFSTLMQAFQNGLDKLADMIPGSSAAELPTEPQQPPKAHISQAAAPTVETGHREKQRGPYQQRCLYLALKTAESFATFLLNLEITVGVDSESPPLMEHFVKTADPHRIRRMCGVDNKVFQAVLQSAGVDNLKSRPGDHQSPCRPHEVTFEHMVDAMGCCVELCAWSLRVCKELRSASKSPFLVGVRHPESTDVSVPLSISVNCRGESTKTSIEGVHCSVYRESSASPPDHVDVAPVAVPVTEFQSLVECVIEKTSLYCARAVNTAFLQNQLYQHNERGSRMSDAASFAPIGMHSGVNHTESYGTKRHRVPGPIHSTVTLLHNALADVAANTCCLSASTSEFCAVLSRLVERRVSQSKALSEAFGDTFALMTAEFEAHSAGFPEESTLLRLFDDFMDPVPLVQFVGAAVNERYKYVEAVLSRHKVPYGVVDAAAYAAMLRWMWSRFVRRLVAGCCVAYPKEAPRYGKLKNFEVRTCSDFMYILHSLVVTPTNPVPGKDDISFVVVVKDYHELLAHEPTLLNTLVRLQEKLRRLPITKGYIRNKVSVLFMGPRPMPPEVTKGDIAIPLVRVRLIDPDGIEDLLRSVNYKFALKRARQMLPGFSEGTIAYLWDGFVHYFVDVVYTWYKSELTSMEFYCRLLWSNFLTPLRGALEPDEEQLGECLQQLCKSIDEQLRKVIVHQRSRFITELHDINVSNMRLLRTQLYKFHGSRLMKYLLLGAIISAFTTPEKMRRRVRRKKGRSTVDDVALWRRHRKFDIWSWLANTEWAMSSNESEEINMDPVFFTEITKELVASIISDLNIDMDQFLL
ncbi:origin recognition complex subunit, putative [Babesia ovata]|uniref:Origin recognition complex subunit, putative n=1 Tax=Babesia ovata TaxID=189622 RepID=A0A2H6KDU9_9APIC|nr:origin recognition complex subunit, putative [Babesia ovata]GBE61166.1 origin recognition complex subunit, putative [Babesia ovata]